MSTSTATRLPVDPREAAFAINVGDWLVAVVDGRGPGWTVVAVHSDTYDLYRDGRDLVGVPHSAVHLPR